jgi:hypothetical protein
VIRAEVHSDDFVFKTNFDATRWFENASNEELINLINCGFGGDYPSDDVARYFAETNEDVADVFDYLNIKPVGFECHVNVDDAENWIKNNRPNLKDYLND